MRIIIFILTLILPSLVSADLFSPPPTDKSIDFLGYIFGPNIGSVSLGGATNPALLHMFERFNAAVITIGSMIISYVGVISTVNTAQEGQVMGRKWSSIWIPLRSVMGMLVIVPAPSSGYSVIQTAVMWCIIQGIGAADNIWNGMLNDLSMGLSATQAINRPQANNVHANRLYEALELTGIELAEDVLRSAVCLDTIQQMFNRTAPQPTGGFNTPEQSNLYSLGNLIQIYETRNSFAPITADQAEYSGTLRIGIKDKPEFDHICGQYHVSGIAKRSEWGANAKVSAHELQKTAKDIYEHKIWAMQLMFHNFGTLASNIVKESVLPRDENNRLFATADTPLFPGGYRNEAMINYRETLKYLVKPQRNLQIQQIIREGMDNGWLAAGSFYFTLNQNYEVDFFDDIVTPPTTLHIPKCNDPICSVYSSDQIYILSDQLRNFLQYGPEISYMGTRLWDAKVYLDNDFTVISDKLSLMPKDASPAKKLQTMQDNLLNLLHTMMTEQHNDPLIAQGKFGASIMSLSERTWINAQNELQATLNRTEQGHISITQELLQKLNNLSYRGTLSVAIYSIVWIIGATLAIYIPLIPYLIFTIAVVGWLLLVIEAIVAAPILAISFMLPSGDELGKVVQGLLLLFNILLRPVLMLFGFILATRLYQAVVKLINFGMLANFNLLDTHDSLFAWVAVLTLYATFVIALSNKCFSLIYALPDKILRWMGSAPEHTDTSQELHHAKSTMLKGADTINKISTGIPERNLARLQSRVKQLIPPDAVRGG